MNNSQNKSGTLLSKVFYVIPNDHLKAFDDARLETNVGRMFAFSIYIIAIQIILNIVNIVKPSDSKSSDINIYIILSLTTLCVGIVYFILLLMCKNDRIKSKRAKRFFVESLLYIYLGIQMIFATLNVISTGGVNSYIIAILILGLMPIIKPLQSLTSILASFAYLIAALYLTRDISGAWDSIMITDTWANLIIITGLTSCMSVIMYNMYASNFMKNVSLEKANRELIKANSGLANMNDQLEIIANTDKMTGVPNRRAFSHDYDNLWASAVKDKKEIAIVIMDIDFFKAYNDTFGHLEGDSCLQKVASGLKNSFSSTGGIVYRYGGEEFIVVFSVGDEPVFGIVEKARLDIEALKIKHANTSISPYVTVSAGVCIAIPGEDAAVNDDLALKIADDALYESKNAGRNRTTLKDLTKKSR